MIDFFIQSSADRQDHRWERKRLTALNLLEADLENVIYRNPDLLCLERLGMIVDKVHLVQQAGALDLMGDHKYPDLLFLTDRGDVGVVEVKRFGNAELRGRHVISQILDYGATICSLGEADQATLFSKSSPPAKRLDELAHQLVEDSARARWVAKSFRDRLNGAQLHYIIACDEAPEGLADWIRSASRNDATDYQISVLEVSPFVSAERPGEVVWLSQPVARTETIHRTTVRVLRDESGQLAVNVSSESPECIAERVQSDQPSQNTNEREFRKALDQLSDQIDLAPEMIREAIDSANQQGLEQDWQWALSRFADPDSSQKPYLRGASQTGMAEGRRGLNLAHPWRPSLFVGHYFSSHDHMIEPVAAEQGGDFAIILDVKHDWGEEVGFWDSPEYQALCARLRADAGAWTVSEGTNPWHPVMLHRPIAAVLKGARSESELVSGWHRAAREGIEMMLAGNEMRSLWGRLQSEGAPD
ncbi:MAG: hypothetical protein CMJ58_27695 [Planctomycetaceae bacterium]|nr:hypothetical protein [Planctomycetaceae bacterium]MBL38687.1 hypothetical protein [Xanthomonadales bacterium]